MRVICQEEALRQQRIQEEQGVELSGKGRDTRNGEGCRLQLASERPLTLDGRYNKSMSPNMDIEGFPFQTATRHASCRPMRCETEGLGGGGGGLLLTGNEQVLWLLCERICLRVATGLSQSERARVCP